MTGKDLWKGRAFKVQSAVALDLQTPQTTGVAELPRTREARPAAPITEAISLSAATRKNVFIACLLVSLFTVAFTLLWWDRYLGVTNDGWHFYHAQQILDGRIPYRDFYLFIPPLHPLRVAAEIGLFGNYLIVPQIFSLLERVILFVVLCIWLCRFFPARYAAVGVITGSALYLSDTSESLSSLHHEAVFWATLAAFCLSTSLRGERRKYLWCAAAGLFAGLAFLGKQTSGVGIAAAIPVFLLFASRCDGWRATLKSLASYAAGLAAPLAAVFGWLARHEALDDYVEQIFLRGPSSKGSLLDILLRPVTMLMEDFYLRRFALMAVVIVAVAAFLMHRSKSKAAAAGYSALSPEPSPRRATFFGSRDSVTFIVGGAVASALLLMIGAALARFAEPPTSFFMQAATQVPLFIAEVGVLALLAGYLWRWVRGGLTNEQWQMFAFAFTTSAIVATLALSWVAFVSMLIPALPLLVSLALSRFNDSFNDNRSNRLVTLARIFVLVGCAVVVVITVWSKMTTPYSWASWREPAAHTATQTSALPQLAGLKLSPSTKERVERITQLIEQHSAPDETVFVYPHMPIFYTLADRRPPTFAAVHFFDVSPDYIARRDAQTILEQPPAVIVDFEFTEEQILDNEHLFRDGNRSGQRDMIAAIKTLTADYDLLESYVVSPRGNTVRVWAKRR